jgi:hypothetical protein
LVLASKEKWDVTIDQKYPQAISEGVEFKADVMTSRIFGQMLMNKKSVKEMYTGKVPTHKFESLCQFEAEGELLEVVGVEAQIVEAGVVVSSEREREHSPVPVNRKEREERKKRKAVESS